MFPQILHDLRDSTLAAALAVLTSMITPALLISATGTFILSTSARLGRCMDRVRAMSAELDRIIHEGVPEILYQERTKLMEKQVEFQSKRAKLLQRSLELFYVAGGIFVATSVAIGLASVAFSHFSWVPLVLGITGACFMFWACMLLIIETKLAAAGLNTEIDFFNQLAKHHLGEKANSKSE